MASQEYSEYADKNYLVFSAEDASNVPDLVKPLYEFQWAGGNGVKWGEAWGTGVDLTWSIANSSSTFTDWHHGWPEPIDGRLGTDPSSQEVDAFSSALELWSSYADISFSHIEEDADTKGNIRIIFLDMGPTGIAYLAPDGELHFNNNLRDDLLDPTDTFGEHIAVHELGHAVFGLNDVSRIVGWDHPSGDNGELLPWYLNNQKWTVMSYMPVGKTYSPSPMILDVLAVQLMYGANDTTGTGDTNYSFTDFPLTTIWDVSGEDTIDLSNFDTGIQFDTRAGSLIEITNDSVIGIAFGVQIENFIGGLGDDLFYVYDGVESVNGGGGDDIIFDGRSANTPVYVNGGSGNLDSYITNRDFDSEKSKNEIAADLGLAIEEVEILASWTSLINVGSATVQADPILSEKFVSVDRNSLTTHPLWDSAMPLAKFSGVTLEPGSKAETDINVSGVYLNPLGYLFADPSGLDQVNTEVSYSFTVDQSEEATGFFQLNTANPNNTYTLDLTAPSNFKNYQILDVGGDDTLEIIVNQTSRLRDAYFEGDDLVITIGNQTTESFIQIFNQKTFGTVEHLKLMTDDIASVYSILPDTYVMNLASTFASNNTVGFEYSATESALIAGSAEGLGIFADPDHSTYQDLSNIDEFIIDGDGDDLIFGSDGSDQIEARLGDDIVFGGAGNDRLLGWQGSDFLYGEVGNDRIFGDYENVLPHGDDSIYGGDGDDYIRAEGGNDFIDGGKGDDQIEADGPGATNHQIWGDDTVRLSLGNDSVDGGEGVDTILIDFPLTAINLFTLSENFVSIELEDSSQLFSSTYYNFEQVEFGGELIALSAFPSLMNSEPSDADISSFNNQNWATESESLAVVIGTDGADQFDLVNELTNQQTHASVFVGDGDDTVTDSNGDDFIMFGSGSDTLNTSSGADLIYKAGSGSLTINASPDGVWSHGYYAKNVGTEFGIGTNNLLSLAGLNRSHDFLFIAGAVDAVTVNLDSGSSSRGAAIFSEDIYSPMNAYIDDVYAYFSANQWSVVDGFTSMYDYDGSGGSFTLNGSDYGDVFDLTTEHYSVTEALPNYSMTYNGLGGDDVIWGFGFATIDGGAGNDVINGGLGANTLTGGTGFDIFEFTATSGNDTITDFNKDEDELHFYYRKGEAEETAVASINDGVVSWDAVTVDLGDASLAIDDLSITYEMV